MYPQNHFFGQAQILSRYAGIEQIHPPRIRGRLQYDWEDLGPSSDGWHFVWSDSARRRGQAAGRRHQFVIGAPWLYLLKLEPKLGATAKRTGTLWFPTGDPDKLIPEIRDTEEGPVTVSLDLDAYQRPGVRAAYQEAGFTVVCRGGAEPVDYDRLGGGPLTDLLVALRRHLRVASDRLTTAVFYGIAAGCAPAVYGGDTSVQCPELAGAEIDPVVARQIADSELGRPWLVPPAELRRLFDWRERV
jgi:hypothetical protein